MSACTDCGGSGLCSTCQGTGEYVEEPIQLRPYDVDEPGQAHAGAGDTEREAARMVAPRTGSGRAKVLSAVAASVEGLTDYEIALRTGLRLYTAAPRRYELVGMGWLKDSGKRRKTDSGTRATVWELTAEAREKIVLPRPEAA